MDAWKRKFIDKLNEAQKRSAGQFEQTLDKNVVPVFEDLADFVRTNGFEASSPLREEGRRSFKFELAENAYLLQLFRFSSFGEFELRTEIFAPGSEPVLEKSIGRLGDVTLAWSEEQFQHGLDRFVEMLAKANADDDSAATGEKNKSSDALDDVEPIDSEMTLDESELFEEEELSTTS